MYNPNPHHERLLLFAGVTVMAVIVWTLDAREPSEPLDGEILIGEFSVAPRRPSKTCMYDVWCMWAQKKIDSYALPAWDNFEHAARQIFYMCCLDRMSWLVRLTFGFWSFWIWLLIMSVCGWDQMWDMQQSVGQCSTESWFCRITGRTPVTFSL